MTLFILALLLFVAFGGSRIASAGKGLGQGLRHVKRALGKEASLLSPPVSVTIEPTLPKLLPAKGESSAAKDEQD